MTDRKSILSKKLMASWTVSSSSGLKAENLKFPKIGPGIMEMPHIPSFIVKIIWILCCSK